MTFYLAIVGTSKTLTANEEQEIRQYCTQIIKQYDKNNTIIISGGSKGVDTLAIEIATSMGFKTDTEDYKPATEHWEDQKGKKGYKSRNLLIANDCDELFCITTQVHDIECYHHDPPANHQKTAGCFTLNEAKRLGKKVTLHVTSSR